MEEFEYIIQGKTEIYGWCLVYVSGCLDSAEKDLNRMINNPTENDKRLIKGHTDLRIKKVPKSDCWWNGNCD
jgi:hypothetical protein